MKAKLERLIQHLQVEVFPEYFPAEDAFNLEGILTDLTDAATASRFLARLPDIKRLILSDVDAVQSIDPAAADREEVVRCYPAVVAMLHYRTAHALLGLGVRILPRMLTEMAHSATGIDIHPAAVIGPRFAIDHGTGIVIGETAVIGENVTLYQGVTLGARNFSYDAHGRPQDIPRHPILEDGVTVYSNASLLGRITIGRGTVIGGNVWLTASVPPNARVLQGKVVYATDFEDGAGI